MPLLALIGFVAVYQLPPDLLLAGTHHVRHAELLGADAPGYNRFVLQGVDAVQAHAMDGGGYFVGPKAVPAESPVGYPVTLFGQPLLTPARTSSYCSGSTYAAFIEALNAIFPSGRLNPIQTEALSMQEIDGSRREDKVKAWGWWNADGFGSDFCLVQYLGMGERIQPSDSLPGDFMNISWKGGLGHSVVFLGWCWDATGAPAIDYWASQKGTNGFGDQVSKISSIKEICAVRLAHPVALFSFQGGAAVDATVPGDPPPAF